MIKGKKIFITGGAGFIGSTILGRVIDENQVTVFDNLTRNSLKDKAFRNHPNLTLINGDVLNFEHLSDSIKDSNLIIHCAAIAGIDTVIQRPVHTMRVNMVGSANLLEAASQLKSCERVVCFSTSEVFGQYAFRASETDNTVMGEVGEARWTYAVSKLAEEHLAIAYHKERGLPTTVVRPFNIYGPGQVGEGAMSIFVQQALKNKTIQIHGDGTQIRAWCYIDDMVEGTLLVMEHPNAIGESFNIGNQETVVTIYGLAKMVIKVLKSKSLIEFSGRSTVDVELRVPAVRKSRELLGFDAKVGLEEGIIQTAKYYKNFH